MVNEEEEEDKEKKEIFSSYINVKMLPLEARSDFKSMIHLHNPDRINMMRRGLRTSQSQRSIKKRIWSGKSGRSRVTRSRSRANLSNFKSSKMRTMSREMSKILSGKKAMDTKESGNMASPNRAEKNSDLDHLDQDNISETTQADSYGMYKFSYDNVKEVWAMLHPSLPREMKMPKHGWIPGYRSEFAKLDKKRTDIVRAKRFTRDSQYPKGKHQYSEKDVMEARSKPIVRCASAYIGKTKLERINMTRTKDDSKIIVNKHFYDTNGKCISKKPVDFKTRFERSNMKKNLDGKSNFLNQALPYQPKKRPSWRKNEKKKWLGKVFKF